ncbi:MAG: lysoplasmalogenase [Treponema sp.]|nr:lysoplasmalogenase [Treponema sp.]
MITFGIYCFTGLVNLVCALFFKETLRIITKCCLMPALLLFYIVAAGENVFFPVIAAIIFSWAGDVFLVKKEKPLFFRLGLAAFLIGHIFYIIAFIILAGSINNLTLIISVGIAIPVTIILLKMLNAPKPMKIPVAVYAIVIMLMSIFALQLMLAKPGFSGILVFASSIVFLFSDSFMAYLLFNGKPKHFNFITMLPYIIAQGGIIMGLALGFGI